MVKLIILISLCISAYLAYLSIYRAWTIVNLDKEIIDKKKREELIKPLKVMIFASLGGIALSIIAFLIPIFVIKCILGFIPMIVCGNLISRLWDELEKFDLSIKESKEVKKFLEDAEKDAIRKSK